MAHLNRGHHLHRGQKPSNGNGKSRAPVMDWNTPVTKFVESGDWDNRTLGPRPGRDGCRVPSEVLQRHAEKLEPLDVAIPPGPGVNVIELVPLAPGDSDSCNDTVKEPANEGGDGTAKESGGEGGRIVDVDAEISRLAGLPLIQYELERKTAAQRLGFREAALDAIVKQAKRGTEEDAGQGHTLSLYEPEPWSEPVDGAALLYEISSAVRRYVVVEEGQADIVALWVVHTHTYECFTCTPRLAVTSPEKRCGKTTLFDTIAVLVPRPLMASNITPAATFRTVEIARPTLLLDEGDTFLSDNDGLRGVLNSGHRKGGQVIRTCGDDNEPRAFSTFCPAAIAMIGKLPSTLEDRSISISMRRRLPGEKVQSFRPDRVDDLKRLACMTARWVADNTVRLSGADPQIPDALFNRVADNWRPLLAIADAAGDQWPARARGIAVGAVKEAEDESVKVLLLSDMRGLFDARRSDGLSDAIASKDVVVHLIALEDRPWPTWTRGKPLNQNNLAGLLRAFSIHPHTVWPDGRGDGAKAAKGYERAQFEDAWRRYAHTQGENPDSEALQPSQANKITDLSEKSSRHTSLSVTPEKSQNVQENQACNGCDALNTPQSHMHTSAAGWSEVMAAEAALRTPPVLGPSGDDIDDFLPPGLRQ